MKNIGKLLKISVIFAFSVAVIAILLIQSNNPSWRDHLKVDLGFYYWVAQGFIRTGTFGTMTNNLYFPGSLFFFLVPTLYSHDWDSYVTAFVITNIVMAITHMLLYQKFGWKSALIFVGIMLFGGPIILYRHELLPSLFLLLSLILWQRKRFWLAGFLLGFSVGIKIYPILIFPYYIIQTVSNKNYRNLFFIPSFFGLGLLSLLVPYIMLGSPSSELLQSLSFNTQKPVHIESLWASGITLHQKLLTGEWVKGKADQNGIYGIDPIHNPIPLTFLNTFWMLPMLGYYSFLFIKSFKNPTFDIKPIFVLILMFTVFSKVITPQYLYWSFLIFPLLNWKKVGRVKTVFLCLLVIIILALTQYIYPLHYNDLLWKFYTDGSSSLVFYLLLARNILLVILLISSLVLV